MTAALASYPELGCTGGPYVITSQPGVRRDILCAGNPAVFDFVEKVLEEVIGLFPSKYIHIGGDESPRTRWRECPECQSLIRRAGLKADARHSAEDKLQGYFNTRIEEFLARHGRRLIGWDEIVDGGMSPDATVMSWRGTAGGIRAADEGFDVIMSPNSSLYFDYYQSANIDTEPPTIGGYIPLKKVYDTEPVPEELTPEQARHIIGVQANVWTTYMRTDTILEHMLLPRLAALAERAWSDREKDFTDFMMRLDRLVGFYDRDGYSHFPHFYDITGAFTADYARKAVGMTLSSLPGADIRYTLDGSEPTEESPLCTDTVWIGSPAAVRAVAVLPDGRRSEPFREEVTFNKATMKPIRLLTAPHPKYAAAVGILPVTAGCTDRAPQEHPNILFILSDDHTSQSWGIYGGILAPYAANDNIARLAAEGCVLDNAFCTNSISVPSQAAILTGQYSHLNGVYTLDDALRPEQDNIAKRLQQAGYRTALIGKWHLKKEPAGFDYYSVFHDQGTYRDPVFKTAENWMDDDKGVGGAVEKGFSTDLVTDKAIRWIKERDRTKPFSMFCHFKATHEPCDFPERFAHLYDGVRFPEPENLLEFGPAKSGRTFAGQPLETMAWRWNKAYTDPENWWTYYPELPFCGVEGDSVANRRAIYQKLVRDYLRCAAAIDDNIGRLLRTLDEEGLAENTVVIYVSDQGYFLGEHGFFDKRIMYEEPLRMPFVIRYPKEIPAGTRNGDIVTNVDFASLLADYAGAEPPQQAQGRSFRSNLAGDTPQEWPRSMYYRYWTQHEIRPAHMGIRNDRYKLIFFYGDRLGMTGSDDCVSTPSWEFYDLRTDPHENRNQYGNPAYAEVIGAMKREMLELRRQYKDTDEGSARMREIMETHYAPESAKH